MQYKVKYQPLERLGPSGWVRFEEAEALRGQAVASRAARPVAENGAAPIEPRELAALFRK
jgi:hypothetical protein